MKRTVVAISLMLTACAPMSEFHADGMDAPNPVTEFCAAIASGDVARIANLFEEETGVALKAMAAAGNPPPLASRLHATNCRPGRVWTWGGSRLIYEVSYDGFADRLDLWRWSAPRFTDLHYGDGGPTLRQRVGLRSDVVRPF